VSQTYSTTETYSVADVDVVMRRVMTDLVMIASSTGAVTEDTARKYGNDIEVLSKNGYLRIVDITLLSNGVEKKATRYEVNTQSGDLTTSRPGGVLWPSLPNPELRIVLTYTSTYDATAKEKMRSKLLIGWVPTYADTSHSTLYFNANRDYVSNGYGMQRKDFSS
jgi:hypothetical protein